MVGDASMKILLLNYPYLAEYLRQMGLKVVSAGTEPGCDHVFPKEEYSLHKILAKSRFKPDIAIFMDSLQRMLPTGLENADFPLGLFCLDSTINRFWQKPLSSICDLILCDQLPETAEYTDDGLNAHWFLLAADADIYHPQDSKREFDITFVGGRNPATRPKRENILKALQSKFNLQVFSGKPPLTAKQTADVYRRSRLVLNENLFPGINLRLFEAMACNTAVLTENNAPGIDGLFNDGRHLITYDPENLIEKVAYYLQNYREREEIAETGCAEVMRKHTFAKRAEELYNLLTSLPAKRNIPLYEKRAALGETFLGFALKWHEKYPSALETARNLLQESLKEHNSYKALLALGKIHCIKGDAYYALSLFNEACSSAGNDFRAPLYAGEISALLNNFEKSGRYFNMALKNTAIKPPPQGIPLYDTPEFHLFWGNILAENGDAIQPGLMKFNLPVPFWSALEHYRQAAQIDKQHWENVGDLLMKYSAPAQAIDAYKAAGKKVDADKLKLAEKQAYIALNNIASADEKLPLLTLCMIVKDEEQNLKELLTILKGIPDQIVVGDTGSTDNSLEIARQLGAEVLSIPWTNDFAQARNRTLQHAKGRYIIYLDADDRIEPVEMRKLKALLQQAANTIFFVKLVNKFNGETCLQKRVFPNHPALRFQGAIHEQIVPAPQQFKFVQLPIVITHTGYDDREKMQKKSWRNLRIIETELVKKPDDFYLHYHAALCLINLNQTEKAVEHLKTIVFDDKSPAENTELYEHSLITLAKIFRRANDLHTVANILNKLLQDIPHSAMGHYYLAVIHFEAGQFDECQKLMQNFFTLELKPKGIPIPLNNINGWAHYYLGRSLEEQGQYAQAIPQYLSALNFLQNQAQLLYHLGHASAQINDKANAVKYLRMCLNLHPQNIAARELLTQLQNNKQ